MTEGLLPSPASIMGVQMCIHTLAPQALVVQCRALTGTTGTVCAV